MWQQTKAGIRRQEAGIAAVIGRIEEAGRKRRRAEQMILAATRVRAVMPRYMNAEEINAAIQEGRITLTL